MPNETWDEFANWPVEAYSMCEEVEPDPLLEDITEAAERSIRVVAPPTPWDEVNSLYDDAYRRAWSGYLTTATTCQSYQPSSPRATRPLTADDFTAGDLVRIRRTDNASRYWWHDWDCNVATVVGIASDPVGNNKKVIIRHPSYRDSMFYLEPHRVEKYDGEVTVDMQHRSDVERLMRNGG